MGSVAAEKERGTAAFLLTKPITRGAFVAAKVVAIGSLLAHRASAVAGALCWIYTTILFEPLPVAGFAARGRARLALAGGLRGADVPGLGRRRGRRSWPAASGFGAFVVAGILSALPGIGAYMPTSLWGAADQLALGTVPGPARRAGAVVNVALIAATIGLAWWSFRRQEL